ncbi:MAG: hypothetical protein HYS17_04515 [Micavibrio aeruginosavorus]|uniref:Uncharacterized protein n=1 Tax=Micavibrio aeruginosavorus TaxID=349221 RepID=A0A7T5R3S5_9BACT|nr:MAG: hypothetical protein HYS17_04515 [Micavibrio aeruginosavorus]
MPLMTSGVQALAVPTTLRADAPDTIPFKVINHAIEPSGETVLTVDARTIGDNKWAIAFDKVTKAAIMMPGKDANSTCPYIKLDQYQYTIEQTRKGFYEFQIKTKVSSEDSQLARDNQCLVVDLPSSRKIKWKDDPN